MFPLMCYTDSDEELWQEDPYEYIRMKFGKSAAAPSGQLPPAAISESGQVKSALVSSSAQSVLRTHWTVLTRRPRNHNSHRSLSETFSPPLHGFVFGKPSHAAAVPHPKGMCGFGSGPGMDEIN